MDSRRQLWMGYSAAFLMMLTAGLLSVVALRVAASSQERLAHQCADRLLDVERLHYQTEHIIATTRGFSMTRDSDARERVVIAAIELDVQLADVSAHALDPDRAAELGVIRGAARRYLDASTTEHVASASAMHELSTILRTRVDQLAQLERDSVEGALERSHERAVRTAWLVGLIVGISLILSAFVAAAVMRRLSKEHLAARSAVDDARRATLAREEDLAIVSHDLRGPLSTILMSAEVLSASLGDHAPKQVGTIRVAVAHMKHLVDQLLDAANLEAGTIELDLARCEATDLIGTAIELVSPQAARASVHVRTEAAEEQVIVRVDRERVLQVLVNLVGNALKFSPEGASVHMDVCRLDRLARFSVRDEGQGIPADELGRVFERYWHASNRGIGLGLYICKKLVEAHGGEIRVDSIAGMGTCFQFTLPLDATR
jgi:signal transduction histidine kinase